MAIDYTAHKVKSLAATIAAYQYTNIVTDEMVDVSYDEDGDISLEPIQQKVEAADVADTTALNTSGEVGTAVETQLDQLPTRKAYPIPTSQEEDLKFSQTEHYSKQVGTALARMRSRKIIARLAGSGATAITGDFHTRATLRANTEALLQQSAETLAEAGVVNTPDNPWTYLMRPKCFYALFGPQGGSGITSKDMGGDGELKSSNQMGVSYLGFMIYPTFGVGLGENLTIAPWDTDISAAYRVNMAALVGVGFAKDALRLRQTKRKPDMTIEWCGPAGQSQHLVTGRIRVGTKVRKVTGVVLATDV